MVMVINDLPHPLCSMSIGPPHSEIQLFQNLTMKVLGQHPAYSMVKGLDHIWPLKFKDQGHCQGHYKIWWSYLRLMFNRYLCFSFRDNRTIFGWDIANSMFDLEIQGQGHGQGQTCRIWGPELNRYVCFLFRDNWTIFGWGIANFIFDLENSRSRSRRKSSKI